jgi:hypothetical protein
MKKQLLLIMLVALLSYVASAQTWYSEFDNGGTALVNGASLIPPTVSTPGTGVRSIAHLKVGTGAAIISNTVNTLTCGVIEVCVLSDNYTGDDGDFWVMLTGDAAKTVSNKLFPDVNGDGVISDSGCAGSDCVPLDGDPGSDIDVDGTARQTFCWTFDPAPGPYIFLDQETVNITGSVYAWVTCK